MSESPPRDLFRAYHRGRRLGRVVRLAAVCLGAAVLIAGLVYWPGASPHSARVSFTTSSIPPTVAPSSAPMALPNGIAPARGTTNSPAPVDSPPQPDSFVPTTLPQTGGARWVIEVATEGYQAELDQCLWVRMDLDAVAPIVGAHNNCGGGVVLDMAEGDTVILSGVGLDGTYTVHSSRNAHAGDSAAAATSGWSADVILQTCYWNSGGLERLLALQRVTTALS